jgi:hypothetical protein
MERQGPCPYRNPGEKQSIKVVYVVGSHTHMYTNMYICIFTVLRIEPRDLDVLGNHCTTEIHSSIHFR